MSNSLRNWREVALADVASEITVGFVGTMANEYVNEGVPFLRSLNVEPYRINTSDLKHISPEFHKRIGKSKLFPGDLAVVRTGKPGTAAVIPDHLGECNCSDLVIIRPSDELDTRFLAYVFNSQWGQNTVMGQLVGSVQKHFNIGDAKRLRIRLPPVDDQREIARILGALDDKIELNRRMNATLEATARAIFKSWFVDFDAVRAKAEGRQPEGMDAETAALFPDSFEESELGEIPAGWSAGTLGDVAENLDSKRVPLSKLERQKMQGTFPYYGAASILDYVDDYLFDGVYVLMAEDSSVQDASGHPVLQYVWGQFWVNNHAHVLRGINGVSTEQIYLALREVFVAPYVTGAVQQKINQENMNRIPFMIGDTEICAAFYSFIEPLFAKIRANKDETRTMVEMRDALLPKLISGAIKVGELES